MYKKASQQKLRFVTNRGVLSVEQLWDLSLTDLTSAVKTAKKAIVKTEDDDLSFLEAETVGDLITVEAQLRFDILKDIYITKKKESEERRNAAEVKAHNQKILSLIAEKKENSLREMSVEDLEKMLK